MILRAQITAQAYRRPRARPLVPSVTSSLTGELPRKKNSTVRLKTSNTKPLASAAGLDYTEDPQLTVVA